MLKSYQKKEKRMSSLNNESHDPSKIKYVNVERQCISEGENRWDGLIRARRHMKGGSARAPAALRYFLLLLYYNRGLLAVIFNRRDWGEST